MGSPFLFVYGTLRRKANTTMADVLVQRAEFVGNACYQGRLYKVGDYPGVVPSNKPTDWVQGEVYRLRNQGLLLPRLDRYEECGPHFPQPTEYVRKLQAVRLQGGKVISVWVYLYNWPTDQLVLIPLGNFLNHRNGK